MVSRNLQKIWLIYADDSNFGILSFFLSVILALFALNLTVNLPSFHRSKPA